MKGFKEFLMKNQVLGLAVAVIMGGAIGKVISSHPPSNARDAPKPFPSRQRSASLALPTWSMLKPCNSH
jgi:hypothetical protein